MLVSKTISTVILVNPVVGSRRRERTLIALLPEAKSETLALGDIVCHGQDNEIKFIAERKTVADLSKSVCDGRWTPQGRRHE